MDFTVTYLGIKVGTARISVGQRVDGLLPVLLLARTGGIAAIADVREALVSHLEVDTLLPRLATLEAVEPGYRHSDRTTFDRAAGVATFVSRGRSESTERIPIPPEAVDFVALVFRLRTLPLPDGARQAFSVLSGSSLSPVEARVEGREAVDTEVGRFPAVKVRIPTGFTGKFSEKNPTFVWFSDDSRRIVVRIGTDFAIGRATALLTGYAAGAPLLRPAPADAPPETVPAPPAPGEAVSASAAARPAEAPPATGKAEPAPAEARPATGGKKVKPGRKARPASPRRPAPAPPSPAPA